MALAVLSSHDVWFAFVLGGGRVFLPIPRYKSCCSPNRAHAFHRYTERWDFVALCVLWMISLFVKWATVKSHTSVWVFSTVNVHKGNEVQFNSFSSWLLHVGFLDIETSWQKAP